MLGDVLGERPKHWCLGHGSPSHYGHHRRNNVSHKCFPTKLCDPVVSASLWHDILPSANDVRMHNKLIISPVGEGSWNVAWDVRPARWLHRPHNAWLLFGICACLAAPPLEFLEPVRVPVVGNNDNYNNNDDGGVNGISTKSVKLNSANYRVTGVPADGRCLFRAIAHMVCLRNGEEAPDENRQKELADDLRVQVVDELMKRRKEIEWFIEGDFDAYIKRIQKPFVWGGEPELLMASHVLKTTISVYMLERGSDNLSKIATYGEEYKQPQNNPIKVLFHGYGHYDILEDI